MNETLTDNVDFESSTKLAFEVLPDDLLASLIALGDLDAFAEAHRRYEQRLLRIALRITNNVDDARDAVQEAFLNAFRKIGSFRSASLLTTWLTRIVINCCLVQLRRRRIRPTLSLDEESDAGQCWLELIADETTNLETAYVNQERSLLLNRAIADLKPDLRYVLECYRDFDPSMVELAQRIGLTTTAAKSRLLRAKKVLKKSRHLAGIEDSTR